MKILITGMNKAQTHEDFYLRQHLKVVPSHYSLLRSLRDAGHTVDQLIYDPSMAGKYDKVIVFLAGPRQMVTGYLYQGLEAIADYPTCVLAFDDWQTAEILHGLRPDVNLYDKFILGNQGRDADSITEDEKRRHSIALDTISSKKNRVLLSVFAGGDCGLLLDWPKELLYGYNPNPYHLHRKYDNNYGKDTFAPIGLERVSPALKKREFNFASLVQSKTKKWIKAQKTNAWPINYYGSKAEKQDRYKEWDMVRIYEEQWACLMPGYHHAGSGWWRARPTQCADAGSILIGDKKELEIYYGVNNPCTNIRACDIEDLDTATLTTIADMQRDSLYALHPLNKQKQQDELAACLFL